MPQTYHEVIRLSDASKQREAMEDKINSLNEINTFTIIPLPNYQKNFGGH